MNQNFELDQVNEAFNTYIDEIDDSDSDSDFDENKMDTDL